ncbi:MAG: hypothetical protein JW888_12410 [Pirellulales bacterium]|nr:hypothetical protein [Pirellulales bacterium]
MLRTTATNDRIGALLLALSWCVVVQPAWAGPRVVLREPSSKDKSPACFYQVQESDRPRPEAYFPTEKDAFELLHVTGTAGLKQGDGSDAAAAGQSIVFRDSAGWPFVPKEPVTVYDFAEVPSGVRGALSVAIRAIVMSEVAGKPYDKTRVKKKEEYVRLPAPTIRNLKRTKRHRVLATEEEYQIQAELDGQPTIEITHMPYLKQHDRPERGVLLFVAEAELPVTGRVRYKIPSVLNVSTGYRATVALCLVVEVCAERDRDKIQLDSPEVLRVDVRLRNLDLSNDVLNAARKPIRDFINEEARRKHDRICRQANKTIRKAVDDQTFRLPLLRYLGLL